MSQDNIEFTDLASEDDLPEFSREEVTIVNFLTMCQQALEPDPAEAIAICRALCKHRKGLNNTSLAKCLKQVGYYRPLPYSDRQGSHPASEAAAVVNEALRHSL